MSTVNALYHIVINTYRRQMTLGDAQSEDEFRQMVEADGLQWNDYKLT